MSRLTVVAVFVIALSLGFGHSRDGQAMGAGGAGGDGALKHFDIDVEAGNKALNEKQWQIAVTAYTRALDNPMNARIADVHNRLGFALRNNGQMKEALAAYAKALAIDPKHKGAHEYAGEAYLKLGDIANAKFHLAELNKICFFGCVEHTELKTKIAQVEGGKPLTD